MIPVKEDISPALVELLLTGNVGSAGLAATLVSVARKGYVCVREREDRQGTRYEFELLSDKRERCPSLTDPLDQLFLRALTEMTTGDDPNIVWKRWHPIWREEVLRMAEAQGMLSSSTPRRISMVRAVSKPLFVLGILLLGWGVAMPSFASLLLGGSLAGLSLAAGVWGIPSLLQGETIARWRMVAEEFRRYPQPTDALPLSREEWDLALTYALAVGCGSKFLSNVHELCEYYERSFQGVVMTFYTPHWYVYDRNRYGDRFAFLTEGMSRLLDRFSWKNLMPADIEEPQNSTRQCISIR